MVKVETTKIMDAETRAKAFQVIKEVYLGEKRWINSVESEIPENIADLDKWSWFLATVNGKPAGVIRLQYDPSLEIPPEFEFTLKEGVDLTQMIGRSKFVEIGRFMILPRYRKNIFVALRLMRAASAEVIARNYSHFITDVFEGEVNSPLKFHTRILGFEVVGHHLHGELNCRLTRIILTLDILKAYKRLKRNRNRISRFLTEGIPDMAEAKFSMKAAGRVG
ncbi:MAG: N-acyl amino acid synthase FeeM domain-containing protein [Pyrinomonadaceae bacterium]